MAGAQPWKHVFLRWSLLFAHWENPPLGKNSAVLSAAAQRGLCHRAGTFDRARGESGISGLGLPKPALSLSWTDLSDLFITVAAGILFWHDAAWCGRAGIDTAAIKR